MAIPVQTPRNSSIAAPAATVFPYGFKILDKTHLRVEIDEVVQTVDLDYTVSGVGEEAGGDVTFLSPLIGGEEVLRIRDMPYSRTNDFQALGDLRSATLNNDQDAPVMMIQQIATRVARMLAGPDSYIGDDWNYDAGERRIYNLADPVDGGDAVNLRSLLSFLSFPRVNKVLAGDYFDLGGSAFVAVPTLGVVLSSGRRYRLRFVGSVSPAAYAPAVASPTSCEVGILSTGVAGTVDGRIEITYPDGTNLAATIDSLNGLTGNFKRTTGLMTSLDTRHVVMIDAIIYASSVTIGPLSDGAVRIGMAGAGGGDPVVMYAGATLSVEELI